MKEDEERGVERKTREEINMERRTTQRRSEEINIL